MLRVRIDLFLVGAKSTRREISGRINENIFLTHDARYFSFILLWGKIRLEILNY